MWKKLQNYCRILKIIVFLHKDIALVALKDYVCRSSLGRCTGAIFVSFGLTHIRGYLFVFKAILLKLTLTSFSTFLRSRIRFCISIDLPEVLPSSSFLYSRTMSDSSLYFPEEAERNAETPFLTKVRILPIMPISISIIFGFHCKYRNIFRVPQSFIPNLVLKFDT